MRSSQPCCSAHRRSQPRSTPAQTVRQRGIRQVPLRRQLRLRNADPHRPGHEQGREAAQGRPRPVRRRRRRRLALGRGLLRRASSASTRGASASTTRIKVGEQAVGRRVRLRLRLVVELDRRHGVAHRPEAEQGREDDPHGRQPGMHPGGRGLDLGRLAEHERHLPHRPGDESRHERRGRVTSASSASTRTPTASGSPTTPPTASRGSTRRRTPSSRPSRSAPAPPTASAGPTATSGSRTATARSP